MAKRSNPFNDSAHQLKTHVGIMEFAKTTSGRSTMARIESNTLQCLRNGARKIYSEQRLKQNCQTLAESFQNNKDPNQSMKSPGLFASGSCPVNSQETCRTCDNPEVVCRCSFCNSGSCSYCFRSCSSCESLFCSLCAVVSYENSSERAYCLTCIK